MTAAQQKNIIQWTLFFHTELDKASSLQVAKTLCDSLGVAFPHGDCGEVLKALQANSFLGWRSCTCDEAQHFSNIGVTAIGIDFARVIILIPDREIANLSDNAFLEKQKNNYVKNIEDLSGEEQKALHFFAYNYGFPLSVD